MYFWTFDLQSSVSEAPMMNKMTAKQSGSPRGNWQNVLYRTCALALAAQLVAGCAKQAPPPSAPPPTPVSVIQVQPASVAVENQWVGTLDGNVNAQIQPQVSGYLIEQTYREGSTVAKGQVLFEIDPRPFQALVDQTQGQVAQTQGQVAQAQGQLEQAKAAQGLAQTNVNRDKPLADQHAIAQSQLDTENSQLAQAAASVKAAEANVEAAKASVKAAEAAVETAKLNLGFTHVRSLINGVAGQATTQVGNLVSPQSVLTSVSQLNPIRVYFSLSDSEYLALTKRMAHGGDLLKSGDAVPLTLSLSDGKPYQYKGKIAFVDRQMNQQTGAIRIAATFQNPGNVLRPGQFARVSANTEVQHNVILVPQAAVLDLQGQKQVYTVGADNKVHVLNVSVGQQSGTNVIVLGGLPPGTSLITDNLQKLREGAPVAPHAASTTPNTDTSAGGN
jgi:membrane fusion protein, multidrug efflux system